MPNPRTVTVHTISSGLEADHQFRGRDDVVDGEVCDLEERVWAGRTPANGYTIEENSSYTDMPPGHTLPPGMAQWPVAPIPVAGGKLMPLDERFFAERIHPPVSRVTAGLIAASLLTADIRTSADLLEGGMVRLSKARLPLRHTQLVLNVVWSLTGRRIPIGNESRRSR